MKLLHTRKIRALRIYLIYISRNMVTRPTARLACNFRDKRRISSCDLTQYFNKGCVAILRNTILTKQDIFYASTPLFRRLNFTFGFTFYLIFLINVPGRSKY